MILPRKEQVCSFEWAKKMKKLKFKQDSLWSYGKYLKNKGYGLALTFEWDDVDEPFMYSAYTVAELLKLIHGMTGMLPVLHDRDLKPGGVPDYLAEIAYNLKSDKLQSLKNYRRARYSD